MSMLICCADSTTARLMADQMTGVDVKMASTAQDAVDILDANPVSVVAADIALGSHTIVELLHEIRSYDDWLDLPVIAMHYGDISPEVKSALRTSGVRDFFDHTAMSVVDLRELVDKYE